jgi:hypothetical protein
MTDEREYANDPIPKDDAPGVAEPITDEERAADPLRDEDDPTVAHEPTED